MNSNLTIPLFGNPNCGKTAVFNLLTGLNQKVSNYPGITVEKKIANLRNNLYEAELDYYYLSSPEIITKNIIEYSNEEYSSMDYSRIYFSLEQFLNENRKTTKSFIDEKKIKKK